MVGGGCVEAVAACPVAPAGDKGGGGGDAGGGDAGGAALGGPD